MCACVCAKRYIYVSETDYLSSYLSILYVSTYMFLSLVVLEVPVLESVMCVCVCVYVCVCVCVCVCLCLLIVLHLTCFESVLIDRC